MTTTYKNYINGKWVRSRTGETFENINPANTDDVIGRFQKSNSDDVKLAVDAAFKARKMWRETPAPRRGEILFRVAELLVKEKNRWHAT